MQNIAQGDFKLMESRQVKYRIKIYTKKKKKTEHKEEVRLVISEKL